VRACGQERERKERESALVCVCMEIFVCTFRGHTDVFINFTNQACSILGKFDVYSMKFDTFPVGGNGVEGGVQILSTTSP